MVKLSNDSETTVHEQNHSNVLDEVRVRLPKYKIMRQTEKNCTEDSIYL